MTNPFPKTPPPNVIMLGVRVSTYEWSMHGHKHSVCPTKCYFECFPLRSYVGKLIPMWSDYEMGFLRGD